MCNRAVWLALICVCIGAGVTCVDAQTNKGKVLVVFSSEHNLTLKDGKKHPTGFFMNEFGVPVKALIDAGYEPVFADPEGNAPTMDAISEKEHFFRDDAEYKKVKSMIEGLDGLKHPETLSKVAAGNLDQYAAVFVPGGHAPMENLWYQPALGKILTYMHAHNKPTALICHGPIALLAAAKDPKPLVASVEQKTAAPKIEWPYNGYHMTVFSDAEEKNNEPGALGGYMKFWPEDALKAAGAEVSVDPPSHAHVVQDRELITGQNPSSDNELAEALLKALQK
jgi:putative intracellular protease/amidase